MTSNAKTIDEYVAQVPPERLEAFEQLLQVVRGNIDPGFEERISYGMIGWVVPHSIWPAGYHVNPKDPVPFVNLANQKHYFALYHMAIYANPTLLAWFQDAYTETGYKLDMGKGCIRFKNMKQIPYELMGQLIARVSVQDYLTAYSQRVR
jgi:uncharacterized protein YdhG (YjbR/CyaY superfamily)